MRHRLRGILALAQDRQRLAGLVLRLALSGGERDERTIDSVIYVASGRRRGRPPALGVRIAMLVALLATPRMAAAQTRGVETPTEIFEPEEGRGIPLSGSVVLYNRTLLEGQYDSNIYNVGQHRTDDFIAMLDTDFRLATRLPRHEFEVYGGAGVRRYADTSAENSETYDVGGRTLLDLGDRVDVRVRGGYTRAIEKRGTAGDQFLTDHPVRFDDTHVEASIARTGGILEAGLSGAIRERNYLDDSINGVPVDLGHRDATIRKAAFKTSYRLSPVMRLYAELGGNQVDYVRKAPILRDSSGYSALAGIRYEVTRLVDLTAAVGYMRQNFKAPGVKPVKGLNYKLAATWTPTPKWRLTASGERVVDASPLSDIPAIVRSNFGVTVQRALGERVLVEAGVSYTDEDYRGLSGTDRRYSGYGNIQYRLTNNIAAVVGAGYRKQTGGASGRSYSGASATAGLRIAL
ncbi:MAG TPA: outer membrane beta-barrel protein [Novosphingobium sp.]|nr:outer membrane beta-barrel protein [Novosphingobium sp.]